jgi:3-oxoadipate enol-lactonase
VLLHSALGDRRLWDDQVEAFAPRYRVVRPDLRGFGETPLPGGPFSWVDDVRVLLDHLEIGQAALVVNSLGGRVALELTVAQPQSVSALVLVGSALGGREPTPEVAAYDAEEEELLDAGKLDEAVELNLRMWVGDVDPARRERVAAMQRRAFEIVVPAYEQEPQPGPVAWTDPPAHERLGEIAVPTLVLVGEQDVAQINENADRLAAEIPGARKIVMEGAKHLPAFEQPEEFNRIVLGFLAEGAVGAVSP